MATGSDEHLVLLIQFSPEGHTTSLDFPQHIPNALPKCLSPAFGNEPPVPSRPGPHTLSIHTSPSLPWDLPPTFLYHLWETCPSHSWGVWTVPRPLQCKPSLNTFHCLCLSFGNDIDPVVWITVTWSVPPSQSLLSRALGAASFWAKCILSFTVSGWQPPS